MALKFYASVRLEIRRIEPIKQGTDIVGGRHKVKVVKNKVAPPHPGGRVRHHVQRGHLGCRQPARRRGGAGHRPQERRLVLRSTTSGWARGARTPRGFIKAHPEVAAELERRIKAATAAPGAIPIVVGADEAARAADESPDGDQLAFAV